MKRVEWKRRGSIATLTVGTARGGREAVDLAEEFRRAAEEIELDDQVAVVVLRSTGAVFSRALVGSLPVPDWSSAVAGLTRPVIAALQGDATAEAAELALCCDLRIVARGARIAFPQIAEGRMPRHGATQRLPRLVGRGRALELLLSGRSVASAEAERIGLVNRVVARPELGRHVRLLAQDLAGKGPIALRAAKEAVLAGVDLTLDQGIRLEQDLYVLLQTTSDRREGVSSFLAKRRPRYRGK